METFEFKDMFNNTIIVEQHETEEFCIIIQNFGEGVSCSCYLSRNKLLELRDTINTIDGNFNKREFLE